MLTKITGQKEMIEKKKGLQNEAVSLYKELTELHGISSLKNVRLINRYDV